MYVICIGICTSIYVGTYPIMLRVSRLFLLSVYHILLGMELQVELPMILFCDNKGAVELATNWSAGGSSWHMDSKQN